MEIHARRTDIGAFESVYQNLCVPLAFVKLDGKVDFVVTKVLTSPQGIPPFYRIAEIHFLLMQDFEVCAALDRGKQLVAEAVLILPVGRRFSRCPGKRPSTLPNGQCLCPDAYADLYGLYDATVLMFRRLVSRQSQIGRSKPQRRQNYMISSRLEAKSHTRLILFVLLGFLALALPLRAQKQDLTLSLGGFVGQTRGFDGPTTGQVDISSDKNFGVNYGFRFLHSNAVDLFGELEFVAIPNQSLTSANAVVPILYASLYVAPGLRVKFFPGARLSPWGALGGGYGLYEEADRLSNGQVTSNRLLNRGVFDFGGGLDYRLFRFVGLRAEVRDFFSGNPNVNVHFESSTQHNVVASGGIVLHF
jgi:hypothetical protein